MQNRHRIPILLLIIAMNVPTLYAQSSAGRFFLLKPSAVSGAMGGTGVAIVSPFASYHNPAGLAFAPAFNVTGSFVKPIPVFDDVRHSYITGSVRLPEIGTVGISANLYRKGEHGRTISHGPGIVGTEDLMDWQIKPSYGYAFSDNVAAGINIGLLRLDISEFGAGEEEGKGRSTTVLADAGILYRNIYPSTTFIGDAVGAYTHRGISIGVVFSNIGPNITMIDGDQSDPPPATITAGAAYSPVRTIPTGLMVTIDLENHLNENSILKFVHLGTELAIYELLLLRGGYYRNTKNSGTSYWTWGAGLRFENVQLNMAKYTRAFLPSWHFDATISLEI